MKLFFIIVSLMIATTGISYSNNADYVVGDKNLYDLAENMKKKWEGIPIEERQGWKQFMRWYNFWEPRVFPTGDFPNYIDIVREKFEYDEILKDRKFSNLSPNWQALGPFKEPTGNQSGIGRVNAVRFKPGSPNEIWIGAASGGAWITKNNGATWNKIPFTQFLSLGVSEIAFAPSNPQTAYISTGDIFGSASSRNFYSIGVIKTTDGGLSWNVTGLAYKLSDNISTSKIMVHPDNENLLLVGSSRGIWKSEDGGVTWSQSYNGRAFIDMEMKPDNPNHILATSYSFSGNSGIFISEDFGESWTIADEEENSNRIAIAFSESNPNIAYAILSRRQFYSLHSFKSTSDGGKTWNTILDYNTHANILGRSQGTGNDATVGQGQYDLCIAVNPKDHEDVFVGGINTWRSRNAGNSWDLMTHWFGGFSRPYVHADIHDLVFAPDQVTLYNANDGGIDRINITSGNWQKVDDGLNIMQFYKMNSAPQENNMIVAGAQDNGTSLMEGSNWKRIGGGDGMDCAIDPTNPNIIYFSSQNGNFSRSQNRGNSSRGMINSNFTGEAGAWTTPFIIDPINPNNLYVGYENVWRSTNKGDNWGRISNFGATGQTLRGLYISPSDNRFIYAHTQSALRATFDAGANWELLRAFQSNISGVAIHPENERKIYISLSGFNSQEKVIIYENGVSNNITGNLPNVPVNCIVYQPDSPDRIYVGTDIGVYYTDNGSSFWLPYNDGLPNVIIDDIEIHEKTQKLRISSYGMGIWEAELNNCETDLLEVEIIGETKFCFGETIILRAKKESSNYLWSSGQTTREIEVSLPGTYSLVSTEDGVCYSKSESIEIETISVPNLNFRQDGALCREGSVTLTAGFGFSQYQWSNGETSRSITIDEPTEGIYLIASTSTGCSVYSDTLDFYVTDPPPIPVISRTGFQLFAPDGYSNYVWYRDGNVLQNTNSNTIFFDETSFGEYEVEVFDEQGCSTISPIYDAQTSVEEQLSTKQLLVTPNPSNGEFEITFELSNDNRYTLEIFDVLGNLIYSIEDITNQTKVSKRLDMTALSTGVYWIKIKNGENYFTQKLILN